MTTIVMLGSVVAAVAGAALPPAHAAAGEPGTVAFTIGGPGNASAYEFSTIVSLDVGPRGNIVVLDSRMEDGLRVFHPNGTLYFGIDLAFEPSYPNNTVHIAPNGSILVRDGSHVISFHPNGAPDGTFETREPDGTETYPLSGELRLLPGGKIAVSQNGSRIAVFHSNGTYDFSFGQYGVCAHPYYRHLSDNCGPGRLATTTYAAVGPTGKLFVESGSHRRIEVFHPNGTYDSTIRVGGFALNDVGPSGEFVNGHSPRKTVYYPNGTYAYHVFGYDCKFGPTGMVVCMDNGADGAFGTIIVVQHGIEPDTIPPALSVVGPYGPPAGVPPAAPPMSLTGGVLAFEFGSYGQGPGEFLAPHNIAFGPGGIIAVSDATNHRVQLFHPNGTFAFELGSRGSGPGELHGPYGLAFGPYGLLAVSDVGNHRVQVFRIQ